MIHLLPTPKDEIERAIRHAEDEFPKEACGAVIDNVYVPFPNDAEDPEQSFIINSPKFFTYYSLDKIQAVIHSHNNQPHASKEDQQHQKNIELPYIILNMKYGKLEDVFFFGFDKVKVPFEGRPFHFGCWDCLTLVRDYYKQYYKIDLPNPPRDFDFVKNEELLFEKYLNDLPLLQIDKEDIEVGNVLFYTWKNKICHVGIYLGDNKVLGHWMNQLSAVHPLEYKYKNLAFAMEIK